MSEPFKPDLDKKLYTIVIDVHPNINVFKLEDFADDFSPNVQHIVGALEVVKMAYLRMLNDGVQKAWEEHQKKNDHE